MKCQKCGQNEVNFYYSSNVNGAVTETHLCSPCATDAGYDIMSMFSFKSMFEELMPISTRQISTNRYFIPIARRAPVRKPALTVTCECGNTITEKTESKADAQMKEIRELNMQMRAAVEKEEFEKAAEIRDRIKELKQ